MLLALCSHCGRGTDGRVHFTPESRPGDSHRDSWFVDASDRYNSFLIPWNPSHLHSEYGLPGYICDKGAISGDGGTRDNLQDSMAFRAWKNKLY